MVQPAPAPPTQRSSGSETLKNRGPPGNPAKGPAPPPALPPQPTLTKVPVPVKIPASALSPATSNSSTKAETDSHGRGSQTSPDNLDHSSPAPFAPAPGLHDEGNRDTSLRPALKGSKKHMPGTPSVVSSSASRTGWVPEVGKRVCRNPTFWEWGDQDGGAGKVGEIVGVEEGWVAVRWEATGRTDKYRWGAQGAYDVKPVGTGLAVVGALAFQHHIRSFDNRCIQQLSHAARRDIYKATHAVPSAISAKVTPSDSVITVSIRIDANTSPHATKWSSRLQQAISTRTLGTEEVFKVLSSMGSQGEILWGRCWADLERGGGSKQPTPATQPRAPARTPVPESVTHKQTALLLTPPSMPVFGSDDPTPPTAEGIFVASAHSLSPVRHPVPVATAVPLTPSTSVVNVVLLSNGQPSQLYKLTLKGDLGCLRVNEAVKRALQGWGPPVRPDSMVLEKDGQIISDTTLGRDIWLSDGDTLYLHYVADRALPVVPAIPLIPAGTPLQTHSVTVSSVSSAQASPPPSYTPHRGSPSPVSAPPLSPRAPERPLAVPLQSTPSESSFYVPRPMTPSSSTQLLSTLAPGRISPPRTKPNLGMGGAFSAPAPLRASSPPPRAASPYPKRLHLPS